MLRYPLSVESQQGILAPLTSLLNQVPGLELWISFMASAEVVYDSLSVGALTNLSNIASSMAKVCDSLYASSPQSIYSSQYLLQLATASRDVKTSAALSAQSASGGTIDITVTQAAQTALNALMTWDPVQSTQIPTNPGSLATILMQGVSLS